MEKKEIKRVAVYGVNALSRGFYEYFLEKDDEEFELAAIVQVKEKGKHFSFHEMQKMRALKKDFKSKYPGVPFLSVDGSCPVPWEKYDVDVVIDFTKAEEGENMEKALLNDFKEQASFHFQNKSLSQVHVCSSSRMAVFTAGKRYPVFETQIPQPRAMIQIKNTGISPKGVLLKAGGKKEKDR